MGKLLKENTFDHFLLKEGFVRTFADYRVDGTLRTEFFDNDECESLADKGYVKWESVKQTFFELIKGKKTPLMMQFIFIGDSEFTQEFLKNKGLSLQGEFLLNFTVTFRDGNAKIVTGTYRSTFTVDKQADREWDDYFSLFLKDNGIAFEKGI